MKVDGKDLMGDVIIIVRDKGRGQKMFHGHINRVGVRNAVTSAISWEVDFDRLEEIAEVPLYEED